MSQLAKGYLNSCFHNLAMLYLASKSPRRRQILKKSGIEFSVLMPKIKEVVKEKEPRKRAILIAEKKVRSVAHKVEKGIILGVDTIVVIGKRVLGKPKSKQEAKRMLLLLSRKNHRVISGIFLLKKPEGKIIKSYEETKVRFRKLSNQEIENYLNTREPYDKAGAYAIQGQGGLFIAKIEGCYQNVIGFPLPKILKLLKKLRP